MINFKTIVLAATLTAGSVFGTVSPVQAGTCWYAKAGNRMVSEWCSVKYRVNANGHNVIDIVDNSRNQGTIVLWTGGNAEVIYNGQVFNARWFRDSDGDVRISNPDGSELAFRA